MFDEFDEILRSVFSLKRTTWTKLIQHGISFASIGASDQRGMINDRLGTQNLNLLLPARNDEKLITTVHGEDGGEEVADGGREFIFDITSCSGAGKKWVHPILCVEQPRWLHVENSGRTNPEEFKQPHTG